MTLPYFQVDTRNERLKTLSAKHASLWEEFNQKLDISWIFHDHGLEGVVLQFQEIAIALNNNKVITDSSFLPTYQEIKNMNVGIHSIREQVDGKKSRDRISRNLLQQTYSTLSQKLRGLPDGDGLRQEDGRYGAYYHKSCSFTEIDAMLKKVILDINQSASEDLHPIVQATRLHYRLMKVMPYGRFSGKISRLVSNLMLMRHGYPPAILHTVERARYYEALAQDDEAQLLHLVIEGLTSTVESGLQYIEEGLAERRRKREARKAVKLQREKEKAAKVAKSAKAAKAAKASKAAKAAKVSTSTTPKTNASKSVASKSVASKSVASKSVASKSVASKSVAPKSVAPKRAAKTTTAKTTRPASAKAAASKTSTGATSTPPTSTARSTIKATSNPAKVAKAKPAKTKAKSTAKAKPATKTKATKAKAKAKPTAKTTTATRQSAKKSTSKSTSKSTTRKTSRAK